MPLLPMRSSVHATAVRPDWAISTDSPYLFAGADDTGNCAHTVLPWPSSLVACMVDSPYPGESTQNTNESSPLCTFLTNVCVAFPSGTSTSPVGPQSDVPCPSNF